ncbi:hypothetical protein CR513_05605, partial [Mucuna pruriens]
MEGSSNKLGTYQERIRGEEEEIRYGILDPKIKERIMGYEGNHWPNPKTIKSLKTKRETLKKREKGRRKGPEDGETKRRKLTTARSKRDGNSRSKLRSKRKYWTEGQKGSPALNPSIVRGRVVVKIHFHINMFLLCMTRSNIGNLHAYDPEIDRTFHKFLRNYRSNEVANSSSNLNCSVFASNFVSGSFASDSTSSACASDLDNSSDSNFDLCSSGVGSDSNFGVSISQFSLDNMEDNDRTLKELATSDSDELKFGLIYLLPKFHGLEGEDLHNHLKEFHVVCSTMRAHGILEDYIKMKAFPFSLDGATKD